MILSIQLDLPCCNFDENKSNAFQHFLEMVDALATADSDKLIPKFNAYGYNEFKMNLKRFKIIDGEVVFNHDFYKRHI